MKLAEFFASIAPYFEGRIGYDEAAAKLFPEDMETKHIQDIATIKNAADRARRDRERLSIYGRFCENHRYEALESTFSETRAAVIRGMGEPAWDAIVSDYFRAHPMRHAELNENGSELPAFLARERAARGLPLFIAELADLEWWEFRTRTAPDDPLDALPDAGPLRLGATVELRPYQHELASWLSARADAESVASNPPAGIAEDSFPGNHLDQPEAAACVLIFWRDRELASTYAETTPLELAILHALVEGRPLDSAAERAQASEEELRETADDLHAAGILRGLREPS